jgi:hypothetical protein
MSNATKKCPICRKPIHQSEDRNVIYCGEKCSGESRRRAQEAHEKRLDDAWGALGTELKRMGDEEPGW